MPTAAAALASLAAVASPRAADLGAPTVGGASEAADLGAADLAAVAQLAKGAPGPARVTLALAFPDFLRLVSGKLDGMQAFFSGKLKVSGDMMFAQTMQSWFKQNRG